MHTNIFGILFSVAIMTHDELYNEGIDTTDINLFVRGLLNGKFRLPYKLADTECISTDLEKSIIKLSRDSSCSVDFCNIRDLAIDLLKYNGLQGDIWDWRQMI